VKLPAIPFSSDNTQEIVNKIINKHHNGNWIKYTRHTTNKGAYSNALWIISQTSNKYIAFCEGDDYWIDPYKLQKQIDFLEKSDDYNLCYHDVLILNSNGIFSNDFINKTNKLITTKYDLAVWGNYMHTCSVVVRNNKFLENYNKEFILCDYISYIQFVNDGKIKKIEEIMSVYRYVEGIWSGSSYYEKQKFILDNIFSILKTTEDDTIKKIMNLRLDSTAFYSLPNYITKIEDTTNRSFYFELNEKIPKSILLNVINKKIILKLKKIILKFSKFS
jgi:glycosyltransferase involved in cell wall biosynthesis